MLLLRLRHSLRSLVNRLRYLFSSFFCGFEHIGLRCLPSLIGFWSWRRFVFMLLILILLVLIYLDLIPVSKFEVFFNVVTYFDCITAFWIKKEFEPSLNHFWTWTEPPQTWTKSSVQGSGVCLNRIGSLVLGLEKCWPEPDWTELRQP